MDIKAKTYKAESEAVNLSSQAVAEGRISPPAGMPDIKETLFVEGKARLLSAECVTDKIITDGTVIFYVVYLSVDDTLESFSAASAFKHSFEAPGVTPEMRIHAQASLTETEFYMESARDIYVKGVVDIECEIMGDKEMNVSEFEGSGLQMKKSAMRLPYIKDVKSMTAIIREDVRIPQNMPPVKNAVFADGYAEVKNITSEDYKTAVEGDLNAGIVYLSSDENMPVNMLNATLSFGEVLHFESLAAGDDVHVEVHVDDVTVRSIEDTPDLLNLEAVIKINATVRSFQDMEYTEDMYSVKTMLDLRRDTQVLNQFVKHGSGRVYERDTIRIMEPYPPVVRVTFVRATAFVSKATAVRDAVQIEGLIFYRLHYASADGARVYKAELPYRAEIPVDGFRKGMRVFARVHVENCTGEGSGRDINVKCSLFIRVSGFGSVRTAMVTDVVDTGAIPDVQPGMTVYFTDGQETLWDIAKKFYTPVEVIKKYNLDINEDDMEAGRKILVFNRRQ